MDPIYAFGVEIIKEIQFRFSDYEEFFSVVNWIANPHYVLAYMFPFVAIFDSVWASQLLLVAGIGEWLNAVLKWILMEDRPFWWVKETKHYGPMRADKPQLAVGPQTCETGPGSPSGHLMSAACVLYILVTLSTKAYKHTRSGIWIRRLLWLLSFIILIVIAISRMFIATHFPHQCLLGIFCGFLTAFYVSKFLVLPFHDMESMYRLMHPTPLPAALSYMSQLRRHVALHVMMAALMISSPFAFYWGMKVAGIDPLWSVKLAFKWCPAPEFLHFNTTPLYAFVEATGYILGWALAVTPSVNNYRYNKNLYSLTIGLVTIVVFHQASVSLQAQINRDSASYFYLLNFLVYAARPLVFLRVVPMLVSSSSRLARNRQMRDQRLRGQAVNKDN